jgi:hypothetical protein
MKQTACILGLLKYGQSAMQRLTQLKILSSLPIAVSPVKNISVMPGEKTLSQDRVSHGNCGPSINNMVNSG